MSKHYYLARVEREDNETEVFLYGTFEEMEEWRRRVRAQGNVTDVDIHWAEPSEIEVAARAEGADFDIDDDEATVLRYRQVLAEVLPRMR